jgi:hypothetical protein
MSYNVIKKIVSADDDRISRFHTEDDLFIGWKSVFYETPVVTAQKIMNGIKRSRPEIPWWPLKAIQAVEKRLAPNMRAIEFGSGSSSLWIARRVRTLVCREHDGNWAEITQKRLVNASITNCDVQHRHGEAYYSLEQEDKFDFAVVDGEYRWKCIEALSKKMNPGGLIYFDNSDSDKDKKHYSEFGIDKFYQAQKIINELEINNKVSVIRINGMINGELFSGSGTLIKFHME